MPPPSDSSLTKVILFHDSKYSDIKNHEILNSTITYIIDSKHLTDFCSVRFPFLFIPKQMYFFC